MWVKKILATILDYVLPYRCINCADLLISNDSLCARCFHNITFINQPFCQSCCRMFEFQITGQRICDPCIAHLPAYTSRSLFKFDTYSKKIVHKFKYYDCTEYAELFARLLVVKYKNDLRNIDCIVPVPMHRFKRVLRQYNPPQILANELTKRLNIPTIPRGLIKKKWTKAQQALTKNERRQNLYGSIITNPEINFKGLNVLLIDDVKTTGATAAYCTLLLKAVGAANVVLFTIACT